MYATNGLGDISQRISYTLAEAPRSTRRFRRRWHVDAADYVAWRKTDNTTTDEYTDDSEGNFGADRSADMAEPASAVPEPTRAALVRWSPPS